MNVTQLPDEILIIIFDKMNKNIFPVLKVNKELNRLSQKRIQCERAKYDRKIAFYARCSTEGSGNFLWNGFHGVVTLEECDFMYKHYVPVHGYHSFISRIKYTIGNTYQIAAETWTRYLQLHSLREQKEDLA